MASPNSKIMAKKYNKLPSIEGLTEKPAPIRSGRPLKERVKICYRSDLYMAEQRRNVISFQEQLRQALTDLKTAKPDSLQFHTSRVEQLKVKADEMIIILQICGKINNELSYARKDLLTSVENGSESQLINKRRKRVQWLENKLEQIIIQHSPARKEDAEDGGHSDIDFGNRYSDLGNDSVNIKSAMSSFPADLSRLQTAESNDRLNTAGTVISHLHLSMNGTLPEEIIGANQSGNRLVLPDTIITEHGPSLEAPDSMIHVQGGQSSTLPQQRSTLSKLSFKEPLESGGRESSDPLLNISPYGENGANSTAYDDDDYDDEDDVDDNSDRDYGSHTDAKSMSQVSVVSSLFTDVTDEAARRTRRSSRKEGQSLPKSKQSEDRQTSREVSKVIVKSPEDKPSVAQRELYDAPAEDYWQSEHHRVEFSALRPYLDELDPNSLHQVAIAIPGNYVDKPSPGRHAGLPWREAEDNRDVNHVKSFATFYEMKQFREALDRLSKQLVQIQEKVYAAAIQSVESMGSRMLTRASKRDFSSMAKTVGRSTLSSRQFPPTTASLPALPEQQEDLPNRFTPVVHLRYYSKEIPKAKTLPISRVNRDKCYPQNLTSFVFPDPDGRPAPERLVNQGRLFNDTKLVIYKTPVKKRSEYKEEKKVAPVSLSTPALPTANTMSSLSLRGASKMAFALGAIRTAKSDSVRSKHVGLKWDRVKFLYETSLQSKHVGERQDAARQLGVLDCSDPDVFDALKTAIIEDSDERVQYEAAKALLRLGCLEDELIQILVDYLIVGNDEVKLDMLKTLANAKDISFINKQIPSFGELLQVLAHLCLRREVDDLVSFEAATAFGKICVKNSSAVDKMMHYLNNGDDTHKKAEALRILIKQFNESSWNLVEVVLKQFTNSPVWGHRKEAAQLLQHLGRKNACSTSEGEELVYSILERRLWDDSVEMVRMEAAHTLGVLDMYSRAAETVIKRLSDLDPTTRAHAVTSLGTLGIKQAKVLRVLTEMLELDPSDNVRREVIRAFGSLQVTEKKIIRLIKEKERGDGILAIEAKNVLRILESLTT